MTVTTVHTYFEISIKASLHSCKSQASNFILTNKRETPAGACFETLILNVCSPSVRGAITTGAIAGVTLNPLGTFGSTTNVFGTSEWLKIFTAHSTVFPRMAFCP